MTIEGSKWDQGWNEWKDRQSPRRFSTLPVLPECHTGNCLILDWENGAGLYAGGWTRSANPRYDWVVIDLSEFHHPTMYTGDPQASEYFSDTLSDTLQENPTWRKGITLHLPIKDYSIPPFGLHTWVNLANDVQKILDRGINVLVACDGGHGRTGLTVAILATLIDRNQRTLPDPVAWIRKVYCPEVIETSKQEYYVYDTLGIVPPPVLSPSQPVDQEAFDELLQDDEILSEDWQEGVCEVCQNNDKTHEGVCYSCMMDLGLIAECDYCGEYAILNPQNICHQCMDELHNTGINLGYNT